jgi:hypothetical protein
VDVTLGGGNVLKVAQRRVKTVSETRTAGGSEVESRTRLMDAMFDGSMFGGSNQ